MNWLKHQRLTWLLPALWLWAGTAHAQTGWLNWQAKSNRVDASVQGWPLTKVLGKVAQATGWEVFVEPGSGRTVSAGFRGLSPRDALGRLLGDLSFALVPRTNGPARLLIYQSSRDSATQRIAAEAVLEPGQPVPTELIVRLNRDSGLTADELAKLVGAKVAGRLEELGAVRLQFDSREAADEARKILESLKDVASVENNLYHGPPDTPAAALNGGGAALTLRPSLNPSDKELVIAVIDTGLQTLAPEYEAFIKGRQNLVGSEAAASNDPSHGTAMVTTLLHAAQIANNPVNGSNLRILAYDVFGANPGTTSFDIAVALTHAAQNGATVFNLSLGSPNQSPVLNDVIASLSRQGGLVFAASGNDGGQNLIFPAASTGAFGVTAVGFDGQPLPFANTGPHTDLGAPGRARISYGGQNWLISGTSPAAAFMSGTVGAWAANPTIGLSRALGMAQQEFGFVKPATP